MLATLERPIDRMVEPARTSFPGMIGKSPVRLGLVEPRASAAVTVAPGVPAHRPDRLVLRELGSPALGGSDRLSSRRAQKRPLRMTVRARRLLAGVVLVASAVCGMVAVDVLSAVIPDTSGSYSTQVAPYRGSGSSSAGSTGLIPASGAAITVSTGDTLWSVAVRVDPDADPRRVIAAIMTLNGLDSPVIQPGQVLRLP